MATVTKIHIEFEYKSGSSYRLTFDSQDIEEVMRKYPANEFVPQEKVIHDLLAIKPK